LCTLLKKKHFVYLLASLTIFNILYVQLTSNLGLIIGQNIANGIVFFSWMLSLNAVLVVILQPILFSLVKNNIQNKVILHGYCIFFLALCVMCFFPLSKPLVIFFVICLTIAEIMVFPTSSVVVGEIVEEKYRGMAYGVIDLEYLGSAIGPVIGGIILQRSTLSSYWLSLLLLAVACIILHPIRNASNTQY
jgi:MFS family permease